MTDRLVGVNADNSVSAPNTVSTIRAQFRPAYILNANSRYTATKIRTMTTMNDLERVVTRLCTSIVRFAGLPGAGSDGLIPDRAGQGQDQPDQRDHGRRDPAPEREVTVFGRTGSGGSPAPPGYWPVAGGPTRVRRLAGIAGLLSGITGLLTWVPARLTGVRPAAGGYPPG